MGKYDDFLQIYNTYSKELLFGDKSLRPTKSITRNIMSGVEPFAKYYKINKKLSYSDNEVSSKILSLGTQKVTSTTRDNIRNMQELNFMIYKNKKCKLTRNFIDFIRSGITLKEYILDQLRQISSITDITMFYNSLLCVLKEELLYGEIVNYPDSYPKFLNKVPKLTERAKMCNKIYIVYGFHGLHGVKSGYYTPNASYRILSTCYSLGLITKKTPNEYGFTRYGITKYGYKLLDDINNNIINNKKSIEKINNAIISKNVNHNNDNANIADSLYDDIYDQIYLVESKKVDPDTNCDYIDIPQVLPNNINKSIFIKRDPKKAANAKKRADYKCEYDNTHVTFINQKGNNFCEAHHLIPVSMQYKFFYSLDVEANIVSLCPNCHSILHHSKGEEKIKIIKKLYEQRIERLKKCNIYIELKDLIEIYESR